MDESKEFMKWVARGCQRRSVVINLHGIKTGSQLWQGARLSAPRITLRDTRAVLRQLEKRGIVECLNPSAPCGRLYRATSHGAKLLRDALSIEQPAPGFESQHVELLSHILRGRIRHAVFRVIAQPPIGRQIPACATQIKRYLREQCPMTLNQAIRALRELEGAGAIEAAESPNRYRLFRLTNTGAEIGRCLEQTQWRAPATTPSQIEDQD
jgi:hypothetical protein